MISTEFIDPYGSTWRRNPETGQWGRWDGTQWVTVGKTPPGFGQPPPAPYAPPPRRRRRVWPWVLGSVGVVFLLIVILVVVAIGGAVHELNREQAEHAISSAQFNGVQLGTSQPDVESQLGRSPENSQEFVSEGVLNTTQIHSSCIYYNQTDHTFGDVYQFCFTNGSLTSKNSY